MMFGTDAIIVLPILLLLAALGGLIAFGLISLIEATSRNCPTCGHLFVNEADLEAHIKQHKGHKKQTDVANKLPRAA